MTNAMVTDTHVYEQTKVRPPVNIIMNRIYKIIIRFWVDD
jgi:hypothetical protein